MLILKALIFVIPVRVLVRGVLAVRVLINLPLRIYGFSVRLLLCLLLVRADRITAAARVTHVATSSENNPSRPVKPVRGARLIHPMRLTTPRIRKALILAPAPARSVPGGAALIRAVPRIFSLSALRVIMPAPVSALNRGLMVTATVQGHAILTAPWRIAV